MDVWGQGNSQKWPQRECARISVAVVYRRRLGKETESRDLQSTTDATNIAKSIKKLDLYDVEAFLTRLSKIEGDCELIMNSQFHCLIRGTAHKSPTQRKPGSVVFLPVSSQIFSRPL